MLQLIKAMFKLTYFLVKLPLYLLLWLIIPGSTPMLMCYLTYKVGMAVWHYNVTRPAHVETKSAPTATGKQLFSH